MQLHASAKEILSTIPQFFLNKSVQRINIVIMLVSQSHK